MNVPVTARVNPYPGLPPFGEHDASRFFGRDREIDEVLDRLASRRLLAVIGVSGCGKSSLVRAGVIPVLRMGVAENLAAHWRIHTLSPGNSPLLALGTALGALPNWPGTSFDLVDHARNKLLDGESLLLIVDQFEELFRFRGETLAQDGGNTAALFVNLLLNAVDQREVPIYVLLTMRTDFLGECAQFRGLPEALNDSYYLVPRMTRLQQQEAIERPLAAHGAAMHPALVQKLLNDSADDPDHLPVLQHLLKRLWECWADPRKPATDAIGFEDYAAVGGWQEALDRDAESVLTGFTETNDKEGIRNLFQWITDKGIGTHPIRRPALFSTLTAITKLDRERLRDIVAAFQKRDLLRDWGGGVCDDSLIDLPHESVAWQWKRLREWIDEEAESAARLRFIRESEKKKNPLRGLALQEALELKDRMSIAPLWGDRHLPDAISRKEILDWIDKNQQEEQGDLKRQARELADWAKESLIEDPERSLILGMYSWGNQQRPMASGLEQTLHDAAVRSPVRLSLRGHQDVASSVVWSPDGNRLATASWDGTAKVWDAGSGRELLTLRSDSGRLYSVAWSPNGNRLATASGDGTAKVWEFERGRELQTLSGHQDLVRAIAWSPDGSRLATASKDGTAKVWDASSSEVLLTLGAHGGFVLSIAWSPDGTRIATSSEDGKVKVWDAGNGRVLRTQDTHPRAAYSIAWSPDGTRFATASEDKTAKVWDAAGARGLTLRGHRDFVWGLAWSPDGSLLATASKDKTVKVWDTQTGREAQTLRGHQDAVRSIAWSPDGSRVATASEDKTAKVWEAQRGEELLTLRGHRMPVGSISWTRHGNRLATASGDNTAKVWEADSGTELKTLRGHESFVLSVAWAPGGKELATASRDTTAKVWEADSGEELRILSGHQGPILSLAWSRDGSQIATASLDMTAKVWEAANGREVQSLVHKEPVFGVAWSSDGSHLATASLSGKVRIWEVVSGRRLRTLGGHRGAVHCVAWSSDGKWLATASADSTVRVWNTEIWRRLPTLRGHQGPVRSVAWSPDGKRLATASEDEAAKLWETGADREFLTLRNHHGPVRSIAWSPDGNSLASAGVDRVVQVYAIGEKELMRLVRSRITRELTPDECRQYFSAESCPPLPDAP